MNASATKVHSTLKARQIRPFDMTRNGEIKQIGDAAVRALSQIGIRIRPDMVHAQVKALYAGDAALTSLTNTTASVPTPLQFLQTWLPGFVKIITAGRKIDEILGISTLGSWEDEEIVQGILEPTGAAAEYGDFTNIPLTSWNTNFARRSIVRGEQGIQVGILEEARASAMRVSSAEEKRGAAAVSLEQWRNSIGFFGYFNGKNRTYGFLNDPNLPAFVQGPADWSTMENIVLNLRAGLRDLRVQSLDNIDVAKENITLVIPTDSVEQLTLINTYGISAMDWLKTNYPKVRVVSAPEMMIGNQAGGNADAQHCWYMFVESIDSSVDGSTDGGDTFMQLVQTKFITNGVEKRAKGYVEDYSNATAGVLCKRPFLVVRYFGMGQTVA